jgi:hypothetical protein
MPFRLRVISSTTSGLAWITLQTISVWLVIPTSPLTEKEWKSIEFPIAKSLTIYESDKAAKVKGARPDAVKAIDRLKPYKGGNDTLWRLHSFDIIDKHRTLFTVAHEFLFTADWFSGTYRFETKDPDFAGVEPSVEQDIQLEIEKAVSQPQIGQSNALLPSLHQLVDFVDNLVCSFEPHLDQNVAHQ